ncbi:hypothetical protein IC582_000691 [Cucumis melo]
MLSTSPPSYLWENAILAAAHLINKMSSCTLHLQTPLECHKEFDPITRLIRGVPLRVLGCITFVHCHGPNHSKFAPRAQSCVIIDVVEEDRINMISQEENKVAISDETLVEKQVGEASQDESDKPGSYDPSLNMPIALRRGTRSCTKHSMCNYMSHSNLSPKFKAFIASLNTATVLKNINETMKSPKWKTIVMEEMRVLEKNKTWDLCTLPKGHKTMRCKWVFILKFKSNGTLDRYKARLVARGFTQAYG